MTAELIFWSVVGLGVGGLLLSGYRPLPLDLPRKSDRPKVLTREETLLLLEHTADRLEASNTRLEETVADLTMRKFIKRREVFSVVSDYPDW